MSARVLCSVDVIVVTILDIYASRLRSGGIRGVVLQRAQQGLVAGFDDALAVSPCQEKKPWPVLAPRLPSLTFSASSGLGPVPLSISSNR